MRDVVLRRLGAAVVMLVVVVFAGATAYWALGGGRWSWFDCLYFTTISLSTVGYGETLHGFESVPYARALTMVLIVAGTGTVVYVASTATALIVEGDLSEALRSSRQRRATARLAGHVIVCGAGRSGLAAARGLLKVGRSVVVVDVSAERVAAARESCPGVLAFRGDTSDDAVLRDVGIARAAGMVVSLGDDRNTVFAVLSARALNPALRIVARAKDAASVQKIERAGADRVVLESAIAGMRIASEMVRPNVVQFIDEVLRDPKHPMQFAEIPVVDGAEVAGRTLGAVQLRRHADVIVVAVRTAEGRHRFNPNFDTVLVPGTVLIALGTAEQIAKARAFVSGQSSPGEVLPTVHAA